MTDPLSLTAADLLAIPETAPERLFVPDRAAIERTWRALAAAWHPDRRRDAGATPVFQHLASLRRMALQRLDSGEWHEPGRMLLTATDGRQWAMRYRRHHPFELGDLYVGDLSAAWIVDRAHDDLVESALRRIAAFRFADEAMRGALARYLPVVVHTVETAGRHAVVMDKPRDMILLADLLRHVGGRLDARHAAWILSELHCFACWLQWAGLTHNAIAADTVFVSPAHHAVAVLGGWWYATPIGSGLKALPTRAVTLASDDVIRRKVAEPGLDLDLIRALGREMVGDASPGHRVPAALDAWLDRASSGSAQRDYALWQRVLAESFGARRFTPLNVRTGDVYH